MHQPTYMMFLPPDLTPPTRPPVYSNLQAVPEDSQAQGRDEDLYDNKAVEEAKRNRGESNVYDDPHYLGRVKRVQGTPAGVYDNPTEIIGAVGRGKGGAVGKEAVYDNAEGVDLGSRKWSPKAHKREFGHEAPPLPNRRVSEQEFPPPPNHRRTSNSAVGSRCSRTPKFDDTIYAVRKGEETNGTGAEALDDVGEHVLL